MSKHEDRLHCCIAADYIVVCTSQPNKWACLSKQNDAQLRNQQKLLQNSRSAIGIESRTSVIQYKSINQAHIAYYKVSIKQSVNRILQGSFASHVVTRRT